MFRTVCRKLNVEIEIGSDTFALFLHSLISFLVAFSAILKVLDGMYITARYVYEKQARAMMLPDRSSYSAGTTLQRSIIQIYVLPKINLSIF